MIMIMIIIGPKAKRGLNSVLLQINEQTKTDQFISTESLFFIVVVSTVSLVHSNGTQSFIPAQLNSKLTAKN